MKIPIIVSKRFFSCVFILVCVFNLKAQFAGNSAYRSRNHNESESYNPEVRYFYSTDSTVVFNANILLNQKADAFRITLGLNEEAETPKKSIEKINNRIDGFIKKISTLGIKKEDVFVDFISQTKIYDFDIKTDEKIMTQKIKGFEIKKNIIITLNQYSKIEKIIYNASDFQIYDIIKIDYINTHIEQIQQKLLQEGYSILNKKKDEYFKKFNYEIIGNTSSNSTFSYIFPQSQYQEYTAFETSDLDILRGNYSTDNYVKKLERKGKTFYYQGVGYSGYDKVINDSDPEVGIQYVLNLNTKYSIKRNK